MQNINNGSLPVISVSIGARKPLMAQVSDMTGGGRDHTRLSNRDAPDQHPIGAITGLHQRLIDGQMEALSNAEILAVLK